MLAAGYLVGWHKLILEEQITPSIILATSTWKPSIAHKGLLDSVQCT